MPSIGPNREATLAEFEGLGTDEVRFRLKAKHWRDEKEALATEWLRKKDQERADAFQAEQAATASRAATAADRAASEAARAADAAERQATTAERATRIAMAALIVAIVAAILSLIAMVKGK